MGFNNLSLRNIINLQYEFKEGDIVNMEVKNCKNEIDKVTGRINIINDDFIELDCSCSYNCKIFQIPISRIVNIEIPNILEDNLIHYGSEIEVVEI